MTRDELLKQYVALKSARAAGVLSPGEYAQKVAALRYASADGTQFGIDEASGTFVPRPADGTPAPKSAPPVNALPDRFLPLLAVIVKKTIATFIRRLPVTILFAVAGLLVHTYLLAVINNGFSKTSSVSAFLALGDNKLSVMVIWMIGSAIATALLSRLWPFGRKKKRIRLREKIAAVSAYLAHRRGDALAVIAAGVGLALVIGTLVSGTANMSLAIGVGALFASRAGSVIALLARTAWSTAFSTFRSKTVQAHSLAVGYVALFASSAGFLLNTMMTPNGTSLGLLLLAGAMGFGLIQRFGFGGINSISLLLIGTGLAAMVLGYPIVALAHDGGWPEYMGNAPVTPANVLIYLQKGGSIDAVMTGVPPGLAAGFGAALAQALNALGLDLDVNLDVGPDGGTQQGGSDSDNTRILDGDAARDWLIRNGYFDANGNPTQKYRDWQNAPHSADDGSGLRGVATDPDGNIVIVTADDTPAGSGDQGGKTPDDGSRQPGGDGGPGTPDQDGTAPQPDKDGPDHPPVDGAGDQSTPPPDWNRGDQPGEPAPGETTTTPTGPTPDGSDDQDSGTRYNDPEWSMRNNPDPDNMDWDPDTNSWRPKDDIHADKMERQGYGFDPDTDSWRKRPEPPDMAEVPDYSGTRYSTEWKPGLITYDVTTEGLDKHLNNINTMERNALDAYADLNNRIDQAERDGDTWLANELRGQRDDLRSHIRDVQQQKNNIVNAVNNENTRVSDYNDKIRKPGLLGHAGQTLKDGKDIATAIWNDPSLLTQDPDFVKKVKDGIAAAEKVRKGEGVELRPGMFGYDAVKTGPSNLEKFDAAMTDVRDIQKLIDEAKQRGDTGAVDALNKQLDDAKQRASAASDDLQKHVKNIKDWQVKSAQANLSIGRKGAEITAEIASVPSTAHAVTNIIDDFNRGQGLFHRNTFKDSPDGDLDIDLNTPTHQRPIKMTQADIDLDAEFHANVRIGTERANKVLEIMDDPDATDAQKAEVVNRALESRNSKIQLNDQPPDVNEKFFQNVEKYRTQPLFEGTMDNLNSKKMPDGSQRFVVVDADGIERPPRASDLSTASGPKTYPDGTPKNSVGQDLDFYNPSENQIIDKMTGKPIRPEIMNDAIDDTCRNMGINRHAQEINYTHSMDTESYRLRPGETPKQHIQNAPNYDNVEAQHASRITEHKSHLARDHYDTGAESLAEGSRGAVKERNRIVQQMLDAPESAGAQAPEYFNNLTTLKKPDGSHKTVLEVLDDIGYDRVPTGQGQAAIRAATGRDIPEVNLDIAKLQESLIKLRPRS